MLTVNVSEFKATCLRLLEQVRQTGEPIQILKNGTPLAIVQPPAINQDRKRARGSMKGTLLEPIGDLMAPFDDVEWDAMKE